MYQVIEDRNAHKYQGRITESSTAVNATGGWAIYRRGILPITYVEFPIAATPQIGIDEPWFRKAKAYMWRPRLYQLSPAALRVRTEE